MKAIDPDFVVGCIYEAVSDSGVWNAGLDAARRMLRADAVLLVSGDTPQMGFRVVGAMGFNPEALEGYTRNHLDEDDLVRRLMMGPPGKILTSSLEFPESGFLGTPLYRWLLRPSGLSYVAGATVLNSGGAHASLWLARSDQSDDFSRCDLDAFSGLLPHFSRAMTVLHRIQRAELRSQMAEGAFDRLAVGVILLDVDGAPVMCNREAERIAAKKDGFALDRFGPSADRQSDTKRLRDVIRRVGADGSTGDREGAGTVRLLRRSGLPGFHVVVLPLPKRCQSGRGQGAVSVLFVTDAERSQNLVDSLFGDLYGLTDAEVRVVTQLLEGGGLTAAAEKLGLSRNTVHSQLASVFLKTDTRSQSELLTRLLTCVAPVEPPDETSGYNLPAVKPRRIRE